MIVKVPFIFVVARDKQMPQRRAPQGNNILTAVHTVAHSPEALAYCYQRYGPEKLLYGTDHPFAHYDAYNVMVDSLACSEAERQLINRGNAERLLGLSPKEAD